MTMEGDGFADLDAVIARAMNAWRPPPRLSLSAWADRFYVLSAETAAEPGRWKSLPYQIEILDAITDPKVPMIVVQKSARVGFTLCLSAAIAYFIAQNPSSMLIVQPTVDDAKGFSKETLSPMFRDVPVLSQIAFRDIEDGKAKGSKGSATLTHKAFPGGVLSLVGANSGAGFRRISRRVVMFDEVDAYPPSAGNEGDQIRLGMKRSESFHDRKTIAGSTPLIAGASRIEDLFLQGDQRRYHVPCPHCGFKDFLVFNRKGERGHVMRWPEGKPEEAYFECRGNRCRIEHKDKRWMVERGEWIPDNPSGAHRSYHLWSALSYSPGTAWSNIAADFIAAKDDPEKLKTFVNTTLGETWHERGEAPEWERLYQRREKYKIGTVPAGPIVLTCGVDVQKDRFVFEVVGWAPNKESWSIDVDELYGDTALEATWHQLDALLARTYPAGDGGEMPIAMLAIDSGYSTQMVYNWARRHPMSRVIATKGISGATRALVGIASPVEVTFRGKRIQRGYKVWPVGVDIAKSELYGWLRLTHDDKREPPPGYCHFPEHADGYFKQLCSEHLVTVINRRTHRPKMEWHLLGNRENHVLDCFDEETEVLTREGWRAFKSLAGDESLATVNLDTDEIEYQVPEALLSRHHTGDMISLQGRSLDILVTPNHRMVTYRKEFDRVAKRWRFDVPPAITLAKDLTLHHSLKRTATWRGTARATVRIGEHDVDAGDMAELLGWYVSEGYATRTEWHGTVKSRAKNPGDLRIPVVQVAHVVGICQNPGAKSDRIAALVERTPWKWRAEEKKHVTVSKDLYTYLKAEAGCGVANKRVPQWIKDSPPSIIARFVDAAIMGDGWTQDGFRTYATVSSQLADGIQELFIKLGRGASLRRRPAKPWHIEGRSGPPGRDQFHVSELRGTRQYLTRNGKNNPGFIGRVVHYDGMVYCAEVANGTLVCRRRGLAFIAGNCRILARVGAAVLGIDRMAKPATPVEQVTQFATARAHAQSVATTKQVAQPSTPQPEPAKPSTPQGYWAGRPRGGWMGRRR